VHQWFHAPRHGCINNSRSINYRISLHSSEKTPLVGDENLKSMKLSYDQARSKFCIKHEPTRAAVAGILVGFLVGVTCMFIPHSMFWGEAQLQVCFKKRNKEFITCSALHTIFILMTQFQIFSFLH